jgi:choline dehydrogenase-like flavoprotein
MRTISTLWGGQVTGFLPCDFDACESTAGCKWPIRFEDVEPCYIEVAAMLHLDRRYLSDASVQSAGSGEIRRAGASILRQFGRRSLGGGMARDDYHD